MQHFNKAFPIFVLILFFYSVSSNAQIYFGGGLSFNSNPSYKALGIQAKLGIPASDKFDINGNVTYYLASKASFAFDFDVHYKLFNVEDKLLVNPFAGINFTKTEITNNSLSLGISFKVPTEKYTYYIEPRWILDNSQFVFTIGVLL
ncbi:MAG: hypothetical protein IPO92_24235 [Saprospiraceae bacterium]|nr:hypothetical protein [Saprospiraceae bacterium]